MRHTFKYAHHCLAAFLLTVSPAAAQVDVSGEWGATFHEAVHAPPAPKTLAVTFDDAYRSVIELAFPVLSRLGLKGTVFVPTVFAGSAAPMCWPVYRSWSISTRISLSPRTCGRVGCRPNTATSARTSSTSRPASRRPDATGCFPASF